jgi:hypothetical protein
MTGQLIFQEGPLAEALNKYDPFKLTEYDELQSGSIPLAFINVLNLTPLHYINEPDERIAHINCPFIMYHRDPRTSILLD